MHKWDSALIKQIAMRSVGIYDKKALSVEREVPFYQG